MAVPPLIHGQSFERWPSRAAVSLAPWYLLSSRLIEALRCNAALQSFVAILAYLLTFWHLHGVTASH